MSTECTSRLRESAMAYARAGWHALPLQPGGKAPLTRRGVKDATADLAIVDEWWRRWPQANIGLALPRGLIVVDIDSQDALARLDALGISLPSTVRATTGKGRHLWYRVGRRIVRNRIGLWPEVDVKAPGGYVVAPPSVHASGATYRWIVPLERHSIAEVPRDLLDRLTASQRRGRSVEQWMPRIRGPIVEGRRNQTLAEVSGLLFRKLPAPIAAELAQCWAQQMLRPPLPDREVRRTIESIAGREGRQRERGRP